ncbi:18391_t:CDS:10 [Funneliformis geosporum]|uniref:13630_t:CDS:1 n=1 Tax=Funneliformis geosporum TaxID=1117311 RepID=A0A9W4SPV1_9GLOM|nr:18391_t:CDS:10 [Funneliformis geosporum]CAI2176479.1 13630_t:CDS:10 [Funneliformis geosporum]
MSDYSEGEKTVEISVIDSQYKDKRSQKALVYDFDEELDKIKITILEIEKHRKLHLLNDDVKLYDEICLWKGSNPEASLATAIENFAKFKTADAIAKVIYNYEFPDFIIKFNEKGDKVTKREINQLKRLNFEKLLLRAGLILEFELDSDRVFTYIKVIAPFEKLCNQAEKQKLKMAITTKITKFPKRRFNLFSSIAYMFVYKVDLNKKSAVFKKDRLQSFEGSDPSKTEGEIRLNFFNSARRILMVHNIINCAAQINHQVNVDGKLVTVRRTIKSLAIETLLHKKVFRDFYSLHDGPIKSKLPFNQMNLRAKLDQKWVKSKIRPQPLKEIRNYFGEKLALYFAWLGFYTSWLSIATFGGFIVVLYGLVEILRHETLNDGIGGFSILYDNVLTVPYAFIMAVWATFFLEYWKRTNAAIQHEWDCFEFEKEELPRPKFYGTVLVKSPITMKDEIEFPFSAKFKRYLVSVVVILICMLVVLISVGFFIIYPKLWIEDDVLAFFASSVANLISIIILNTLYSYVAVWLTDLENHRTETEYEDALILKTFIFEFVNNYAALFYIFIFKQGLLKTIIHSNSIRSQCDYDNCMTDLSIQLAIIFVGRQAWAQFTEIFIPWMRLKYNKKKNQEELKELQKKYAASSHSNIPQWVTDEKLLKTDSVQVEYTELILQFGFLTLFGSAFPLASLFAFLNNISEIRSDAFKYIHLSRRPFCGQAQDLGTWEPILQLISLISVLTNAIIIAFYSTWMTDKFEKHLGQNNPDRLLVARLTFIILFEHLVFGIKTIFTYIIPDVPKEVRIAIEREQYNIKLQLKDKSPVLDEIFVTKKT